MWDPEPQGGMGEAGSRKPNGAVAPGGAPSKLRGKRVCSMEQTPLEKQGEREQAPESKASRSRGPGRTCVPALAPWCPSLCRRHPFLQLARRRALLARPQAGQGRSHPLSNSGAHGKAFPASNPPQPLGRAARTGSPALTQAWPWQKPVPGSGGML